MAFIITRRRLLSAGASGLVIATLPGRAFAAPTTGFTHGVASGDPRQTSVGLWTRYVGSGPVLLRAEVAEDEAFRSIVASGETEASPGSDNCAHAWIEGLKPGRWYHYR